MFEIFIGFFLNFIKMPKPVQEVKVIAHRGYSKRSEENTIKAFTFAVEAGAEYIEGDVRKTKDGRLILFHDPDLRRFGAKELKIGEMTYEEIKGRNHMAEKIPLLEDVISLFKGKVKFDLDLKVDVSEEIIDLIDKYDLVEQVIITSFYQDILKKIKRLNYKIETGFLFTIPTFRYISLGSAINADVLAPNHKIVTRRLINRAHAYGFKVFVWSVNDRHRMKKYIRLGVDGIITDDPGMLRGVIDG